MVCEAQCNTARARLATVDVIVKMLFAAQSACSLCRGSVENLSSTLLVAHDRYESDQTAVYLITGRHSARDSRRPRDWAVLGRFAVKWKTHVRYQFGWRAARLLVWQKGGRSGRRTVSRCRLWRDDIYDTFVWRVQLLPAGSRLYEGPGDDRVVSCIITVTVHSA